MRMVHFFAHCNGCSLRDMFQYMLSIPELSAELANKLASETIDVSLPARATADGRTHPLSRTIEEISAIFSDMGGGY